MDWFRNLRVKKKLMFSFLGLSVLCLAMGIFASTNLKLLEKSDTELYEEMTVPIADIGYISTLFERTRVDIYEAIATTDPQIVEEKRQDIDAIRAEVSSITGEFEAGIVDLEMQAVYEEFTAARVEYKEAMDQILILAAENRDAEALDLAGDKGALGIAAAAEQKKINQLVEMKIQEAEAMSENNTDAANRAILISLLIAVIVLIASIVIGLTISNMITKPLSKVVWLLTELSKGHLDQRVSLGTKDELGEMADTMDRFADDLSENVVGIMNKISEGDVNVVISRKDEKDQITPALEKTLETIRQLNQEVEGHIAAVIQGKLDTRADMSGYNGIWKELIVGVNNLIDAFVAPINMTAEYIERIGQGNIPPEITDEYQGDFNEIKNNINRCIYVMNGLIGETQKMTSAVAAGKLDMRGEAEQYSGSWGELVGGINLLIDGFVAPINMMAEYMDRIGHGQIPDEITDAYYGDFNDIKNSINSCILGLGALKEGREVLVRMSTNDYTVLVQGEYEGIYAEIGTAINTVSARIQEAIVVLNHIAEGDLSDLVELKLVGKQSDNDGLTPAMTEMIENIESLTKDAGGLAGAVLEGRLEAQADLSRYSGAWKTLLEGINRIMREVDKPIRDVIDVMNEIKEGRLHTEIKNQYLGDFEELAQAVNSTAILLEQVMERITGTLKEIAGGNLALLKVEPYPGDFVSISDSINVILDSLNLVLGDINQAAEQVANGSKQVSEGSQELSSGSVMQASSIQELTASMTEVASQTKQNALNANQASELAGQARLQAETGNGQMNEMLVSMTDINESSNNISKIIKVIDDIAFQTNILALNAAVEAARAGQHGKGFAVVAEEVRNLAARSAEAAKDTTALIQGSLEKVQAGMSIANGTASALLEIVAGIEKSADLVQGIAASSNEQASGIAQINQGIEKVSEVVQNNSATAEESAATSEELSGQAELLKGMVGRFQLRAATALPRNGNSLYLGTGRTNGMNQDKHSKTEASKTNGPQILLDEAYDKY